MPITTVTFDVWETIFKERPDLGKSRSVRRIAGMTSVLRRHGLPIEEPAVGQAYRQLWQQLQDEHWSHNRDIDTPEHLRLFLRILFGEEGCPRGLSLSSSAEAELTAAYVDPIFDDPPELVPGLPAVLREVRRQGYRVGVICNTGVTPGRAVCRLFERWGILDCFDSLGFSNEVGARKPAPEIFRCVLRKLEARPEEAVHVGDNLIADIYGAKQVGMRAVLVAGERPASPPAEPDCWTSDICRIVELLEEL